MHRDQSYDIAVSSTLNDLVLRRQDALRIQCVLADRPVLEPAAGMLLRGVERAAVGKTASQNYIPASRVGQIDRRGESGQQTRIGWPHRRSELRWRTCSGHIVRLTLSD